jgi:hypothetical protein
MGELLLSAIPLVFMFGRALFPATVSVDTTQVQGPEWSSAEERELRGSLVARLLEQGYLVVPGPDDAQIKLAVKRSDSGLSLEATGVRRREYRIDPGPRAVVALELLHRATMVVQDVQPSSDDDADPFGTLVRRSVALEVTGPPGDLTLKRLREDLALDLSSSGFVLAPSSVAHDHTVCVAVEADAVKLRTGGTAGCKGEPVVLSRGTVARDELASQVSHRVSLLLRTPTADELPGDELLDADPAPLAEPRARPKPETRTLPRAATGRSRPEVQIGLGGGTSARAGGIDPLVQSKADLVWPSGWGGRLAGGFMFSRGGRSLSITEWSIQGGPVFATSIAREIELSAGLLGGIRVHHFNYSESDNGSRVGYDFALPAEAALRLSSTWSLALVVKPGVAAPPPDHEVSGRLVWTRGSFYLDLVLGLGVTL